MSRPEWDLRPTRTGPHIGKDGQVRREREQVGPYRPLEVGHLARTAERLTVVLERTPNDDELALELGTTAAHLRSLGGAAAWGSVSGR